MVVLTRVMTPRVRAFCILALLAFTFPNNAISQQANSNRCRAELIRRGSSASEIPQDNACFVLGVAVVDAIAANAWLEPRDIQPSGAGNATPAGTPAQSSAVPTVQPTAVAAAAFAAVAQDSGAESITSISINPATLFSSAADVQGLARLARLADITVFFPVSSIDHNKDGKIDYAGARARINFTAGAQASALLTRVNEALLGILRSELTLVNRVDSLLRTAPDPARCARQLMGEIASAGTLASCGSEPSLLIDERRYAEFRQAAAAAREEADAKFIGLDLRFDYGDPSFGKIRNAAGTALQGGLGFGRRFNPSAVRATTGLRGRVGVRFVTLRDTAMSDWQLDGGVAFETGRVMQSQRFELSAGFEFRYSAEEQNSEMLRTRFAEFRAAANVPLANSSSVALSLSAPLMGGVSPTLSISGNWQQLLAGLMGAR